MSERVDVLAVIAKHQRRAAFNGNPSEADELCEARAAAAELIEADHEYDAAQEEIASNQAPGDPQTPEQWMAYSRHLDAKERLRKANSRRAVALARVGAAP